MPSSFLPQSLGQCFHWECCLRGWLAFPLIEVSAQMYVPIWNSSTAPPLTPWLHFTSFTAVITLDTLWFTCPRMKLHILKGFACSCAAVFPTVGKGSVTAGTQYVSTGFKIKPISSDWIPHGKNEKEPCLFNYVISWTKVCQWKALTAYILDTNEFQA